MTTASLLVELNTEELPPKALKTLSEAFAAGIDDIVAHVLHHGHVGMQLVHDELVDLLKFPGDGSANFLHG